MTENYRKATKLTEIDNAVRFDVPIPADHPFFTEFSDVRGEFENKLFYRTLNVHRDAAGECSFDPKVNAGNKTLLFLAGMRGSGKTSELSKFAKTLHRPQCFFVVTCNLDIGLDINNIEYMDVLIYQLERLFEKLKEANLDVEEDIITSLQNWFSERVREANKIITKEGGVEIGIDTAKPSLLGFLGLTAKVKAGLQGSKETADKVRTVFKNNFGDFARQANTLFEYVNSKLRGNGKAQELLFIIDGMEKTATPEIRRKVIIGEANRIRQVRANTIFTLPVELMSETPRIIANSDVMNFPFVKLLEKDGTVCEPAVSRFFEFTFKRIDESLFDSHDTVREAIMLGGGSPREYLRILQYASLYADETMGKIDINALNRGVKKLSALTAQFITSQELEQMKELKTANEQQRPTPFDDGWQALLEKLYVFEYNDGTYKRVNPVVAQSALYKEYVG